MTQSGGGGGGNLGAAVLRITVDDSAARTALTNLQQQIRAANGSLNEAQNQSNRRGRNNNDDETTRSLLAQQGALMKLQTLRNDLNRLEIRGGDAGRVGELRAQVLRLEEQALQGVTRELREQINTIALLTKEEKNYNGQQTLAGSRKNTAGVPISIEAQRKAQAELRTIAFDLEKQERKGADPTRIAAQRNELLSIQAASEQNINGAVQRRIALLKEGVTESGRLLTLSNLDQQAQRAAEAAAARKAREAERSARAAEQSARASEREAKVAGRDGSGASRERTKFGPLESGGEALGLSVLLGRGPVGTVAGIAGGIGGDILGGRRGGRVGYGLGFAFGGLVDDAVKRLSDLGDALRDPVANFSKLQEAAVLSSRGFESLTEAMIASGRTGQAAALIQLDLGRRYGSLNGLNEASKSGDSLKRGVAGIQDVLNPVAGFLGNILDNGANAIKDLSRIPQLRTLKLDKSDLRLARDTAEGPKYTDQLSALFAQNFDRTPEAALLRRKIETSKGLSDATIGSKVNVARLSGSGLDATALAASRTLAEDTFNEKLNVEFDKLANNIDANPSQAAQFNAAFKTTQANLQVERDTAVASAQNQLNQKFRGVRDRGELLSATGGLTGSGLAAAEDATKRLQYEREILRLREEAAKYPALEAAAALDIKAIEQNKTELANKRMLAERALAADRVASEGRIASTQDRSILAARSVNLTGTGSSILSAIAEYRNAQREVVTAQARAFANPGDQTAALALKEAMQSVRASAVDASAKLIQGFRSARTEALGASTSLSQGIARLGASRTDPNGIRKYISSDAYYGLDRQTNALIYPEFDKARNYINGISGGRFRFNLNGSQTDVNQRMSEVINLVAQDRMNSNLVDLRRANDQASQALSVAQGALAGNTGVMRDLHGSVTALAAKDWSVGVVVQGGGSVIYGDAVNRGL